MKKYLFWFFLVCCGGKISAHPMPSSIVELYVHETEIQGEAKIPLIELANAVGQESVTHVNDPFFNGYFAKHIRASGGSRFWHTIINSISVVSSKDPSIGTYQEVVVRFTLVPFDGGDLHQFTFHYDAVIHQVVTHSALVFVREDWSNGIAGAGDAQQLGIIGLDIRSEKIFPLEINLKNGSWWKGFRTMVGMGMQHIREGTDHLLFLIVLLLPAMLLAGGRQWGAFAGTRHAVMHLLKIVTAFTIGHSTTLLIGATGLVSLPGRPVEVMIAVSILVSAIHALRPLFAGREIFIAGGFGLIHGLAFATILSGLQLSAGKLALSIFGFNLGIEAMQLLIIAMIVPSLVLLSKSIWYGWIRNTIAFMAASAALAWIAERITGSPNFATGWVEAVARQGIWCVASLAVFSILIYVISTRKTKQVLNFQNRFFQHKTAQS